tara:strand:- start:43113 stop:44300 length:1188 start_codon:yes stop_codon:yes gene_type:complete
MIKKLLLSKFNIYDFYNTTIIKRLNTPFYDKVINTTNNEEIKSFLKPEDTFNLKNNIYYITYIPSFVKTKINKKLKQISFHRFNGYLADIKNYSSIQEYMAHQFGSKSRTKIRSYVRRLETCFNVTYKFYYGNIETQTYNALFNNLEFMIKRRFDQRGDEHQAIKNWDYFKQTTYQSILNKKASLFVIYDNDKPIDICLNYHYDNILIDYIRAYDIDYSKFRLGYIDILKQLEWCFENNHTIFDLGPGILTYKKQWCNVTYKFKNHIIFNKSSLINGVLAQFIVLIYKLKIYLDKKNIIEDKANNSSNKSDNESTPLFIDYKFEVKEVFKNIKLEDKHVKINIEDEDYSFLRKEIYEYLYLNFENKNNINVYSIKNEPDSYIVIGKKNILLKKIN